MKLEAAFDDWDKKQGDYLRMPEGTASLRGFAKLVDIPFGTLQKYLATNEGKRQALGVHVGRKSLTADVETFVVDNIRRMDRANAGMSMSETVDMIQDLKPELSRPQIAGNLSRTIRTHHKAVLT